MYSPYTGHIANPLHTTDASLGPSNIGSQNQINDLTNEVEQLRLQISELQLRVVNHCDFVEELSVSIPSVSEAISVLSPEQIGISISERRFFRIQLYSERFLSYVFRPYRRRYLYTGMPHNSVLIDIKYQLNGFVEIIMAHPSFPSIAPADAIPDHSVSYEITLPENNNHTETPPRIIRWREPDEL